MRGAELVRSHDRSRTDPYRLAVGHIGLEAVLRLFVEEEAQPPAFHALTRFLDLLDDVEAELPAQPALEPLVLSFQLKLLWLSGYLPHLASCAACGEAKPLVGFSARAGGAVCRECSTGAVPISEAGFLGIRALLEQPLAGAASAGLRRRRTAPVPSGDRVLVRGARRLPPADAVRLAPPGPRDALGSPLCRGPPLATTRFLAYVRKPHAWRAECDECVPTSGAGSRRGKVCR